MQDSINKYVLPSDIQKVIEEDEKAYKFFTQIQKPDESYLLADMYVYRLIKWGNSVKLQKEFDLESLLVSTPGFQYSAITDIQSFCEKDKKYCHGIINYLGEDDESNYILF